MIRVMTRNSAALLLLVLLVLPAATAVAGDKEGPSSREIKQMIKFGISLGKQGLWKEALYRWQEALRHDPDNPKLLNNIAVALESQGDLEGAREVYSQAEELAGKERYLKRNIEDFEELFTALEQYESQYREPPAGEEENDDAAGDDAPKADEAAEDGGGPTEDAAGEEGEAPEAEVVADTDDSASEPDLPAGDQSVEEVE